MLFMVINAGEPPLDNKLVRQALNHAIDKKTLVEQLYRGRAVALRAPMQETIPELNRSLAGYPYDPQKARDLLKQAGYQGQPIKVSTPTGRYTLDKELGEAVAGMLEKVGVTVEFKASEWGGYAQPLFSGKASGISLIGMGNTVFLPEWVFTLWLLPGGQGEAYTKGRPGTWEGDISRLTLMARGTRERQPLVEKLQAEALDFAPWILLVNLKDVYALSDRVVWEPYPNEMRNLKDARPRN
jgi:peptide/nickel transport system substrate-binding protein